MPEVATSQSSTDIPPQSLDPIDEGTQQGGTPTPDGDGGTTKAGRGARRPVKGDKGDTTVKGDKTDKGNH